MVDKTKSTPVYCPDCSGKTGKMPLMLCVVDGNGDIIIRCHKCKMDINVSELARQGKLKRVI